jgi:thioredoxin-dependent peroxiredoxin
MANVTLKGSPVQVYGDLPAKGTDAHGFRLVGADLKDLSLHDFVGKKKILNIFPSVDTPTCATSVRQFNQRAAQIKDTVVLCISADLPFAQSRFCGAEGIKNVVMASLMRGRNFAKDYGVLIETGPLAGLTARAIVVLSTDNRVLYTQLVKEIADEPDYEAALKVLA